MEEEIQIINENTKKEKFKNFFVKNSKYLIRDSFINLLDIDGNNIGGFFGLNSNLELEYWGRLNNRRDGGTAISHELFDAMMEIKKTGTGPVQQLPSIGCSI